MQDDGFHEIQLNGKQLVFLFMAVTVVSVVIFLCGVLVGRGVRSERADADPLVAQAAGSPVPIPEVPAMAPTTGSGAPATANEDLSYPKHLAGGPAPREELRETPPPAVAAPPAKDAAPAVADTSEPGGQGYAIQLAALGKREEADTMVQRLTGKGYSAYVVAPSAGAPAVFRVRVGKFKDRREAESTAARLQKEEQFKPWIVR